MPQRRVLLLTILAALILYNLWRWDRNRTLPPAARTPQAHLLNPSATSTAIWDAFDQTATLADAPDEQYTHAYQNLQAQEAAIADPNYKPNADALADVRGCSIWLSFYRQNLNKPHADASWKDRASQHIQSCVKNHADIAH